MKVIYLVLPFLLLMACGPNGNETGNMETLTSGSAVGTDWYATDPVLKDALEKYFTPSSAKFLLRLDREFSVALSQKMGDRRLDNIYTLNFDRLRSQVMEEQSINHLLPFGVDDLRLGDFGEIEEVNFLSDKCGYQDETGGQAFRYVCLTRDSSLVTFLESFGKSNPLISRFVQEVRSTGSISPDMKRTMVMEGKEILDFRYPPHRFFYAFFQLLVVDEMDAMDQIQAVQRKRETDDWAKRQRTSVGKEKS